MHYRPKFVTNSSSSCMIIWEKDPENYPTEMKNYSPGNLRCPHCGESIFTGGTAEELDDYMDEGARAVVRDKIGKGCAIFYDIEYLGHFAEDEIEYGTDSSGWYSFQC
jgi:hypothetical protein